MGPEPLVTPHKGRSLVLGELGQNIRPRISILRMVSQYWKVGMMKEQCLFWSPAKQAK